MPGFTGLEYLDSTGVKYTRVGTTAPFPVLQTGTNGVAAIVGQDGEQLISLDNIIMWDQIDGVAVNTNLYNQSVSTMTLTQASNFINLNAGSSTTANAYAILSTIKSFGLIAGGVLEGRWSALTTNLPIANGTAEFGFGTVATNAAPTDGGFFRWASDGTFKLVINNNGTETSISAIVAGVFGGAPSAAVIHDYKIILAQNVVLFAIDGAFAGQIATPATQAFTTGAGRLQAFARVYNSASTPASAPLLQLGRFDVAQGRFYLNKPWAQTAVGMGRGFYQSPITAYGQTPNHANSTDPVSATLSNTAAGYTTLGGRFQFVAVAGAATDFALFAYQNTTGYQLYIDRIGISAINLGAAVATTATVLDWSVGLNSSAVSLATADGAGTWAPRRIPLGMQSFLVGAAIGTQAVDLYRDFPTPLVVDSGRYLHTILEVPVGTATASQLIRGSVCFSGYTE